MTTPTFAKTYNLIAYLEKPAESEGFKQIIDFLNSSSVRYALTVSLTIRTSCIKQFWSTAKVKTVNDEVRVQPLIDGNMVTIKESSIFRTPQLDDEEGISCLSNDAIFTGLANMGYEKMSDKLTFYKAFFSPQWKFLIHAILQCLSAKTTSWNEFSSIMASAIICLATNQKFNFSRVITPLFEIILVPAAEEVGQAQDDVSISTEPSTSKPHRKHKSKKQQPKAPKVPSPEPSPEHQLPSLEHQLPSPSNAQISTAKDSLTLQELMNLCTRLSNKFLDLESEFIDIKSSFTDKIKKLEDRGRMIADMDEDVEINLQVAQAKAYNLDLQHSKKVLSMQDINEEELVEVEEVLEVIKAVKLFTEESAPRRRRGVIIQDIEETATSLIVHTKVKHKDKGKGILIEEPRPLKCQAQIEQDKAFARHLEAELNANINWNDVVEQVKRSERQNNEVMRYQALNRKPLTEAQARKNMMIYLKNIAGFKMEFFKGMTYSEIRPLFKKHYNSIQAFLKKKEEEIVANDDDDVYTEATPLASKMILLVEKKYPLTHFTLQQMLDNVRLEVKEERNDDVSLVREVIDVDERLWNPLGSQTLDREWHKTNTINNQPPQSWMTQLAQALGTQSSFNEFLATPIDFSAFIMNRIKIHNLTQDVLIGLTYDLMKDTCKSVVELEYHLEEVFKTTNDQLDLHNPEGRPYPLDLSKSLPLIQNARGRQVITFDHFINNELEYLKGGGLSQKYTTSITKTKAADYDHVQWVEEKVPRSIWSTAQSQDHGVLWLQHLEEITVRRQDDRLYKFREGDFKRLHRQDIEDMLLLLIQGKLTNLNLDEWFALNVVLRMYTRRIVIQERVEDLQLAAVKPCQEDSSEFNMITGSIYTDQRGTVVIATIFDEVTKTLSSTSVDYY
nr:hypothetical protein [Tanacetum cinerariifolium]